MSALISSSLVGLLTRKPLTSDWVRTFFSSSAALSGAAAVPLEEDLVSAPPDFEESESEPPQAVRRTAVRATNGTARVRVRLGKVVPLPFGFRFDGRSTRS